MSIRLGHAAALLASGAVLWTVASHGIAGLRSDEVSPREFMAFYTVGHVLNESPADLYKTGPFLAKYHALFPSVPGDKEPVFVHAPFEGLFFQPFARIPYRQALAAWQVFSLGLVAVGFTLVWVSTRSLPRSLLPVALLLTISFQPVSVALLLSGQVSGLTFLWIALAIWCHRRGWDHRSGAALSLCLAKPTLLILLVPMLLVGQRWRMVAGFVGGASVLGLASLLMVGWGGCLDYVGAILGFGEAATGRAQGFAPLSRYVDLNSFLRMLGGGSGAVAVPVLVILAICLMPGLVRLWRLSPRAGEAGSSLAWAGTLTWTTLLNLYVPTYDTPIVLLGILLTVDVLIRQGRGRLPLPLQVLIAALYVVPWLPALPIGGQALLQPYTVVLVAIGTYQLWLARRELAGRVNGGLARASGYASSSA